MSVDRHEVERIAGLAKLRFDEGEVARLTDELNGILEHVEALRGVADAAPADGDEPETQLASTRVGEDGEPDALGDGLGDIAPRWKDGFFLVPPPPGVHHGKGAPK